MASQQESMARAIAQVKGVDQPAQAPVVLTEGVPQTVTPTAVVQESGAPVQTQQQSPTQQS